MTNRGIFLRYWEFEIRHNVELRISNDEGKA